ncbi:hypothetical protein EON65_06245 [archaeon]|nr:MAG: hypothetical protein EON65_06245 [archaeon]
MEEIFSDQTLSIDERAWVRKFYEEVERTVEKNGIKSHLDMFSVAETVGFSLGDLHKEGAMMYALWVAVLTVLKKHYKPEDHKYPTFESFINEYGNVYNNESVEEQEKLWHTANWMFILFTLIPARKNKGLAMQVVPKVVEGWHAKYVTGSGQTRLTANRVHIFEVEGNTKANHRGKMKPKKKSLTYKRTTRPRVPRTTHYLTSRKTARAQVMESQRLTSHGSDAHDDVHDGYTDEDCADSADESSINEEVSKTFKLWRQQPVGNIAPLDAAAPDLLRTSSVFDLTSSVLGGPSELQRGYSWTEIPTNTDRDVQGAFSMPSASYPHPLALQRLQSNASSQVMGSPLPYGSQPTGELLPLDSQATSYSLMSPPPIYSSRASATSGAQQSSFAFGGSEAGFAGGLLEPKSIKDMFTGYHITPHF